MNLSPNNTTPTVTTPPPANVSKDFGQTITINFTGGVSEVLTLKGYKVETTPAAGVTVASQMTSPQDETAYPCYGLHVLVDVAPAHSLGVSSGDGQTGVVNAPLYNSLKAIVKDLYGNPVPGTTVNFAVTGPTGVTPLYYGASLNQPSSLTDAGGEAPIILTLGSQNTPQDNPYKVTASATNLTPSSVNFTANAQTPSSLEIVSGNNPQNKKILEQLDFYVVRVLAGTLPVSNVNVTFAISDYPGKALRTLPAVRR